ncbi:MAG TPA: E3 binding domain-containing protein [Candidatus Acidoferrum sp.]|nr:E3 binding domain-containing protein [Candidatus Acidoferrum sp.]
MPQRIVMPSMGMYTEEGILTAWLRPAGARVEMGEAIVEVTTEKVTFEVPSPAAGILHHVAEPGASLCVEALMGYILAEGEAPPAVSERERAPVHQRGDDPRESPANEIPRAGRPPRASPAARRLAAQHHIDLNLVTGSGPGGRIVEADILAKVSQRQT